MIDYINNVNNVNNNGRLAGSAVYYEEAFDASQSYQWHYSPTEISTLLAIIFVGSTNVNRTITASPTMLNQTFSPLDFNHDGRVDGEDLLYFMNAYVQYNSNGSYNAACDLNHDGKIDSKDFQIFVAEYTAAMDLGPTR